MEFHQQELFRDKLRLKFSIENFLNESLNYCKCFLYLKNHTE